MYVHRVVDNDDKSVRGEVREKLCESPSSFHIVRGQPADRFGEIDRSVDRSRNLATRRKLFAALFIANYPFPPDPPASIRMAEIKRRINVSRADGPNVRTENPILACRVARLVRVSSLLHRHRTLVRALSDPPRPGSYPAAVLSLSLSFSSSFYFLIRSLAPPRLASAHAFAHP